MRARPSGASSLRRPQPEVGARPPHLLARHDPIVQRAGDLGRQHLGQRVIDVVEIRLARQILEPEHRDRQAHARPARPAWPT